MNKFWFRIQHDKHYLHKSCHRTFYHSTSVLGRTNEKMWTLGIRGWKLRGNYHFNCEILLKRTVTFCNCPFISLQPSRRRQNCFLYKYKRKTWRDRTRRKGGTNRSETNFHHFLIWKNLDQTVVFNNENMLKYT